MKILFILFILFSASAYSEVFKCNDSGRIVYSSSPCVSGSVSYDANRSSGLSGGAITLQKGANGGYNVAGLVNNLPVNFLIDTGAAYTSLSGDAAYALGIRTCQAVSMSNSAGGLISNCVTKLNDLSFGGFQFHNITVQITPTMRGDSLIGNDLLVRFRLEQSGGVLTLSR